MSFQLAAVCAARGGSRLWTPRCSQACSAVRKPKREERFERARRELCDPARLRELLNRMSAPALAVLSALVGAGGTAGRDAILDDVYARFEIAEKAATVRSSSSWRRCSSCRSPVGSQSSSRSSTSLRARSRPCWVASRSPCSTQARPCPDPAHDGGRGLIAACMALRHVDLEVTQTGSPHRGGAKRLAKQLGVADAQLDGWLAVAIELGSCARTSTTCCVPQSRGSAERRRAAIRTPRAGARASSELEHATSRVRGGDPVDDSGHAPIRAYGISVARGYRRAPRRPARPCG